MKQITGIICFIMLISSAVKTEGSYVIEAFYANDTIIDAKNQNGGGVSLLYCINDRLKAILRGTYTSYYDTRVHNALEYDVTYSHMVLLAGIGYEPPIDLLERYRLTWRNSILLGYSKTEVKADAVKEYSSSDSGIAIAVNTGLGYNLTQNVQFFAEAGLHNSFYYGDLEDAKIYGVQFFAGVCYSLSGTRSLGDY